MKISEVIQSKGSHVVTVAPEVPITELLALLDEHRIGAVVVSADGGATVAGIVSERDIVRALHHGGAGILQDPVSSLMTTDVHACKPGDEVETLAIMMTEYRVRHSPVVEDGALVGIVSIGDIVKNRLDQLQDERNALVGYVQGDRFGI